MSDLPDLMSLADVLKRLDGVIGRTALLRHLADVPMFAGGPTHSRMGLARPPAGRPRKTEADSIAVTCSRRSKMPVWWRVSRAQAQGRQSPRAQRLLHPRHRPRKKRLREHGL